MESSSDYYFDARAAAAYDAEPWLMQDDIPFYVDLAREAQAAGQSVLEVACGTGRVTLPIAETGCRIVGLDNSQAMLDVARGKAPSSDNPTWRRDDMRSFALGERFGLVIVPYRSFLVLHSVEDQKACLGRIHDHLESGGRMALNFFNPDLTMIAEWQTTRRGSLQRFASAEDAVTGGRREYWQSNTYHTSDQLLEHLQVKEEVGKDGAVNSRAYRTLRLRYIFRYEMAHLLALTGFDVEALYGWFDRRPFDDASPEMVWVARRAG